MLISNIINDSFGLLSKQLKFYCWHYKRDLDQRQQQELINILNEHYFERLSNKIKSLIASNIADCRQQVGKLLFEHCLVSHRRHQLIQLIESDLVDIDVRLDNYGRTLLHRTAYNLDVELVKLLIDHGVNIHLRDYAGSTALHIAIQSYRNGGLIYNNEPEVVQNLTQIIRLLLDTDKNLQETTQFKNKVMLLENNDKRDHDTNESGQKRFKEAPIESDTSEENLQSNIYNENLVPITARPTLEHTICRIIGSHCSRKSDTQKITQEQQKYQSINIATSKPSNQESHDATPIKTTNQLYHQALKFSSSGESAPVPLVNTKNAFGRTPLHYCVLVVGEQYIDQIVRLLLSYGANPDIMDTRMKTPLYHLVKRPGVSAVRQKCSAIKYLIESGCDDLGLSIDTRSYFNELMLKDLEKNISRTLQKPASEEKTERIFLKTTFRRVPCLKHLTRLALIRAYDEQNGRPGHQTALVLPEGIPKSLTAFVNRKLLDQTELF